MSQLEDELALQLRAANLTAGMEREWRFHPARRWRFDFAWPANDPLVAVEVEGGIWTNGRHTRGSGAKADMEKYAEAATRAWYVLRVTADHIRSGQALRWIEQMVRREVTR
jgi:hypothetical protein